MSKKKHFWKVCPASSYYVKAHYKTIKNSKKQAVGLMQITDYTFKLIKENQKEL